MQTSLVPAEPGHLALLESLFHLYVYDFTEIAPSPMGDDGRFAASRSLRPYFTDAWRHPFLLRTDAGWAGFAFVDLKSRLDDDPETRDMAQFFVMRGARRHGVGAAAARALFDRFPGKWEVRQTRENVAATAFWRKVIGAHTGGRFDETVHDSDRWRGPVQTFVSQGAFAAGTSRSSPQ